MTTGARGQGSGKRDVVLFSLAPGPWPPAPKKEYWPHAIARN
jgi:hypothetical protein